MKTKLITTVLLAVSDLVLVLGGVTHAQSPSDNYTIYLPVISKPPCTPVKPSVYIVVSDPVVRVDEIVTAAGAIVNDCQIVGHPWFGIGTYPPGILSVTSPLTNYLSPRFCAN